MPASPPLKPTFFITSAEGTPLCMVVQAKWAQFIPTTLKEQTLERSETEEVPKSVSCLPPAQQQAADTPLGWVNRKLCAILLDIIWSIPVGSWVKSLM